MEIVPIFADEITYEGLHSFKYDDEGDDEFVRLFTIWNDTEYIEGYLVNNKEYLETPFFDGITIDELIDQVLNEAEQLENLLHTYSNAGFKKEGENLQMLFKPLDNNVCTLGLLKPNKAVISNKKIKKPILRLYALKVGANSYIITGGAIKLTHFMDEHSDTKEELSKIEKCKSYLKKAEINIEDDLIYYYEEDK